MSDEESQHDLTETFNGDMDLEEKEQKLRLLNEALDAKRDEIVERAERLLIEQQSILQHSRTSTTLTLDDINDTNDDANDLNDDLDETPQDMQSVQMPDNDDEMPRTHVPRKLDSIQLQPHDSVAPPKPLMSAESDSKTPDNEADNEDVDDESALNALQVESEILEGTTIGKDAELRLQRARYKALQKQFTQLVEVTNEKERELVNQEKASKQLEAKLRKYEKENEQLKKKALNEKKESSDLVKKCKRLEHEVYALETDFNEYKKQSKLKNDSMRTNHIRLNRALEDAEKYKTLLNKYKTETNSASQVYNEDMVQLKAENRELLKQKNELLSAFKKQMKLIDILKKQKIHLEAAKALQFTEQQFIKILDIGQNPNAKK
eukprot:CAMPEP_0202690150 /NCGR_PEP_ID=MMETSP1385-20130828/5238_1 /ASSEMBLY_ACC=CAM_ASM_000861 /TAXON_ID=933848 /ORGANISM="Elphidium margaritaceum" /LENGTH=377 /DNA_ID=CAMNT_0049345383 /DNA_START=37 /DNA_END=1170 /DNA_ORIENTATION=-